MGISPSKGTVKSLLNDLLKLDFPAKALAWAATKGKIPTEDMLKRRNFKLGTRPSMCLDREESGGPPICRLLSGIHSMTFVIIVDGV